MSNKWIGEKWAKIIKKPTFPLVILLTVDEKRIDWMRGLASKSEINIIVDHVSNTKEVLKKHIFNLKEKIFLYFFYLLI